MRKKIASAILPILVFINLHANAVETEGSFEPTCSTCSVDKALNKPLNLSLQDQVSLLKNNLNERFECDTISNEECILIDWLKHKYRDYAENCQGFFLNEDGKLGGFSKYISGLILDDIKVNGEESIFLKNNSDFDKYCPQFKNFKLMQKVAFHGWIFELTAFPESSCAVRAKVNANAPTTKAVCMYQLESTPSVRKWRSNGFSPKRCAVSYQEIITMEGCTGCAFDEYKRKVVKDGTPFGVFNDQGKKVSGSYWASQNPLPEAAAQCYLKNKNIDDKTNRPQFLTACKDLGANNEWVARAKFFDRLPRFPLCGTKEAAYEIEQISKDHQPKL